MEDIPGQLSSVGVPVEGHLIDLVRARVSWMGLFHGAAEGGTGLHARVNAIKGSG